jgi:hypothetical protein
MQLVLYNQLFTNFYFIIETMFNSKYQSFPLIKSVTTIVLIIDKVLIRIIY